MKYLGLAAAIALICMTACSREAQVTESGEFVWLSSVEEGVEKAGARNAKIFLLLTNPERCPPCRMLDGQTLVDEEVKKFLRPFVLVKMDAWDNGKGSAEARKFNVRGIPTMVVLDSSGSELGRAVGYMAPNVFIERISAIR